MIHHKFYRMSNQSLPPPPKKIVTHSDTFHTDEVMATAMLTVLYDYVGCAVYSGAPDFFFCAYPQ